MIPSLLKQRLKQNQDFGRLASKSWDQCRGNAFDCCNANEFTNKDGSVSTKGRESSHYQAFTRVSLSINSHFDSILNEDQLKCNSYESFKLLSLLWYCLISRMFSEEDSSGDKIDIYTKLFLSACNSYGKAVKNSNKREKDCSKTMKKPFSCHQQQTFSVY